MAMREGESVKGWNHIKDSHTTRPHIKGFNFKNERIIDGNWVCEPQADTTEIFFCLLAIYHTAIPDMDERNRKISYKVKQHL